jgi:hypothetical protein
VGDDGTAQIQCTGEEGILALAFDGIKAVLAQTQLTEVDLQDVAVVDTAEYREGRVHQTVEVDALQILANQRQTGLVAQVAGQLFDDQIGHGLFTRWVKQRVGSKLLI